MHRSPYNSILFFLAVSSSALFFGCAHYQAGDGSAVPFSTIAINPIVNQSLAPQANEVLNHDLRETFIQNGKVSVVSDSGEAQLTVILTDFRRETIATNSQDTGLASKYSLTLIALCDLRNASEESPYFTERQVTAQIDVFLNSGQTRAETNAIPLLSKKLAQAIEQEVLRVW